MSYMLVCIKKGLHGYIKCEDDAYSARTAKIEKESDEVQR